MESSVLTTSLTHELEPGISLPENIEITFQCPLPTAMYCHHKQILEPDIFTINGVVSLNGGHRQDAFNDKKVCAILETSCLVLQKFDGIRIRPIMENVAEDVNVTGCFLWREKVVFFPRSACGELRVSCLHGLPSLLEDPRMHILNNELGFGTSMFQCDTGLSE